MPITLDITGFYYSIDVSEVGANSVLDVLNRANEVRSPNGGVLSFELEDAGDRGKFVKRLTVTYDENSNPVTRQKDNPRLPLERKKGVYSYVDNVLDLSNRIGNEGTVPGLLAWQYYVFDRNGMTQNQDRKIRSASLGVFPFADGWRVVWRLVGIFGINELIDNSRENLVAEHNGDTISLKAAAQILQNNNLQPA